MGSLLASYTEQNIITDDQYIKPLHDTNEEIQDDDIISVKDEKWGKWYTKSLFDPEFPTTAIIQWRLSEKKYTAKITTDPSYNRWSDPFGDSDDEDDEPQKVELVLTEYEYHRINIKITPQIGCNAGISEKWTFVKPRTFINDVTNTTDKYWYGDSMPTLNDLINRVLSHVHELKYKEDVISISDLDKNYIKTPLTLSDNLFFRLFETNDIAAIIGHIVRRYLGITQITLNFIPNNIFEPLVVDIIPKMRFAEINWLIITSLFIKYTSQNIQSVAKFMWIYDENGVYRKDDIYKVDKKEYLLIFDAVKYDNYGLKTQLNACNKCVILNIVGLGFKTVYFDSFKNIKLQDLVKEFYNFSNRDYNDHNKNKEIIAMYPLQRINSTKNELHHIFYPNTYNHFNKVSKKINVYPFNQNKPLITFDYGRYQKILNWSLHDLGININGCLIEMYCVTGPCIKLMFCTMVGDARIMDVNFDWNLDVFRMYASKLQDPGEFNVRVHCFYKIEGYYDVQETLYDICKDFSANNIYGDNGNEVRLRCM